MGTVTPQRIIRNNNTLVNTFVLMLYEKYSSYRKFAHAVSELWSNLTLMFNTKISSAYIMAPITPQNKNGMNKALAITFCK